MGAWNHHHAIHIAEDEIARFDAHATTFHAYITVHHARARLGVQWPDAAMEHRETHLADLAHIAHQSIGDTTGSTPGHGRGGQQLAPGRNAVGRPVAGQHDHVAGLQIVDQRDLHLVRVFALTQGVGRHVQAGARPPDQDPALVQWPHKGLHRASLQPQAVHHVRQDGRTQGLQLVGVDGVHGVSWWCCVDRRQALNRRHATTACTLPTSVIRRCNILRHGVNGVYWCGSMWSW